MSSDCAKNFHKTYAGQFMECHLNLLSLIRGDGYLPDRISILILENLSFSIHKTNMYYLLQPKLDIVLFEIVFPLMCFNDDDQRLWEEDPHEYVRNRYDDDFCSPRKAATNFVIELVRNRGEENLQKVIYFIVEVFKRYDDSSSPFYKSYRQKDGALLAMGVLRDQLEQTDPYKSELEEILVQDVFPEFSNTVGHLRAKAVWVAGIYASNFSPNNFQSAFGSVRAMMKDPDLYVRVEAVLGFHSFVKACKDLDDIRPTLPQLLEDCVERMNEVENEDLLTVYTLLLIVDKLGEEVAPYAYALCQNLAAALWKYVEEDHPVDVAVYCLQAIRVIIQSISSLPYLVDSVEPILGPIMRRLWTTDQQDVCEEIIEIESYFSETISLD